MGGFQGALPFANDAVAGTVINIKSNGFGHIYALKLVNTTGATAYLQFFDKPAASVTLGTTTPLFFIRLGANESIPLSEIGDAGVQFTGTGISIAGTTTPTGLTGAAISVTAFYG